MTTPASRISELVVSAASVLGDDAARRARQVTARGEAVARRGERLAARRLRYLAGRMQGLAHRLDPPPPADLTDAGLAQRVRSMLGPVYKRLDVPRFHVTAVDGVVGLHGVVDTVAARDEVNQLVAAIPGVAGVRSYLFVGLLPGETRPSEGRHPGPSDARRELFGAVRALDVGDDAAVERLVRAALGTFLDLVPEGERRHLVAHLPDDVRALAVVPRRIGAPVAPRTPEGLFTEVAEACGRTIGTAEEATRAVMATLRDLVPEEATDVRAVLPGPLQPLWTRPAVVT